MLLRLPRQYLKPNHRRQIHPKHRQATAIHRRLPRHSVRIHPVLPASLLIMPLVKTPYRIIRYRNL
ncbi:hypothetical protein HanXRQr2_Chr08g0351671 [Helianthus annuus]|uniref:Uncharacterized protein n=1 Tax=Helianthus annuus TaxID=4232 RepID=A0A251U7T6_HELAN|nr:hypothetical protein HanXRQr2_Chr08g0351671 [Helianthus annuus]KAJ0902656.1 hypothetical protein HanPSC8_Chr08g0339601 [Helianthus annuus]